MIDPYSFRNELRELLFPDLRSYLVRTSLCSFELRIYGDSPFPCRSIVIKRTSSVNAEGVALLVLFGSGEKLYVD
jgi:hypothetical protein